MTTELLSEGAVIGLMTPVHQHQSIDGAQRRLLQTGTDSLSDVELLALVTGVSDDQVLQALV